LILLNIDMNELSRKCWKRVEDALAGDTDFIDAQRDYVAVFTGPCNGVTLGKDGRGYVFGKLRDGFSGSVYQPEYITKMVKGKLEVKNGN
jgi:hypothetical protein